MTVSPTADLRRCDQRGVRAEHHLETTTPRVPISTSFARRRVFAPPPIKPPRSVFRVPPSPGLDQACREVRVCASLPRTSGRTRRGSWQLASAASAGGRTHTAQSSRPDSSHVRALCMHCRVLSRWWPPGSSVAGSGGRAGGPGSRRLPRSQARRCRAGPLSRPTCGGGGVLLC